MRRTAVMLVIAVAACSPKPQHAYVSPSPASAPVPTSSGVPPITVRSHGTSNQPVRIIQQQGNRKLYELLARSTESTVQSQTQFRSTFSQTHVTFYGTDGTKLVGDAPVTQIDRSRQTVTMTGGFHGRTSDGVVLTCDQLQYARATGQLLGTGNVHISKSADGLSMTGTTFRSDLKLTQVHMQ